MPSILAPNNDKNGIAASLEQHANKLKSASLLQLYASHAERKTSFTWQHREITLDLSLQHLTTHTLALLAELATDLHLDDAIQRLFSLKDPICASSGHWRLRHPEERASQQQVDKLNRLAQTLKQGTWYGATGEAITDIVFLACGGPAMAGNISAVLRNLHSSSLPIHFVSASDGLALAEHFSKLRPARTLFIVASRSFTTPETLANAQLAQQWLRAELGSTLDATTKHFIGISADANAMERFGIPSDHQLNVWEWANGRFSSCSAFAIPLAIQGDDTAFDAFLAGAYEMDNHFQTSPLLENLPVLLAMSDIWNRNFLGIHNRAVLPYDSRLEYLPTFMAQLEMESCGKQSANQPEKKTSGLIWGQAGLDARHGIHEFLHHGTDATSCEFISITHPPALEAGHPLAASINAQHAACQTLCQTTARMLALENRNLEQQETQSTPTTLIQIDTLTPYSLGAFISLLEHRVFTQSILWGVNAFEQSGIDKDKEHSALTFNQYL